MTEPLHPLFLPYSEEQLLEHFIRTPSAGEPAQHLKRWRQRIADAQSKDPSFLHRDETLWTAGGLLAVHRHPDAGKRWRSVLALLFGSVPPTRERLDWADLLAGGLELFFEVGLSSDRSGQVISAANQPPARDRNGRRAVAGRRSAMLVAAPCRRFTAPHVASAERGTRRVDRRARLAGSEAS